MDGGGGEETCPQGKYDVSCHYTRRLNILRTARLQDYNMGMGHVLRNGLKS
jgi:hypothetical protein